jgi:hypothetical protein
MAADGLTREALDRLKITVGESPMMLGCTMHPTAGNTAIYEDGHLRLLCRECGFEAAKIKVALDGKGTEAPGLTDDDRERLLGLAGELEHLPAEFRRHFDQDGRDARFLRILAERKAAA